MGRAICSAKSSNCRQRGFTLLEILLVVVIIGVMAGMAVLAIGSNDARYLQQETERLLQVMRMAQDEATLRQQHLGLSFSDNGYRFLQFDGSQHDWVTLEKAPFNARDYQIPLRIDLQLEGTEIALAGNEKKQQPQLLFLASGENSAFILSLALPGRADSVRQLSSDGFSTITLTVPDDH